MSINISKRGKGEEVPDQMEKETREHVPVIFLCPLAQMKLFSCRACHSNCRHYAISLIYLANI
jgi:hypothetical protein